MDTILAPIEFILHFDRHLDAFIETYGAWTYALLFLIIFCETGLVVTPFLPGDSLLFAAGALATRGGMDVHLLVVLLILAAVLGDAVNYHIGHYLGPKAFQEKYSRILKRKYLEQTQRFYEKYGGKTIVLARFVPIVRTFAPFLAGIGRMGYARFFFYNSAGAVLWVGLLAYGGYFFGGLPIVKDNFSIVILLIIVVSVLPIVIEILRSRRSAAGI